MFRFLRTFCSSPEVSSTRHESRRRSGWSRTLHVPAHRSRDAMSTGSGSTLGIFSLRPWPGHPSPKCSGYSGHPYDVYRPRTKPVDHGCAMWRMIYESVVSTQPCINWHYEACPGDGQEPLRPEVRLRGSENNPPDQDQGRHEHKNMQHPVEQEVD